MAHPNGTETLRAAAAIALTAVAGFVDAFGWLTLDRVFTAQMSGNTVLIAVHAAAGARDAMLLQTFTVAMFFFGLLSSGTAIEIGKRHRFRHILAVALAIEAALLALLLALFLTAGGNWPRGGEAPSGWPLYLLVALPAMAMGTQNTSLRMAGVLGVYTTHVTGALTKLGEDFVTWGFATIDRWRGGGRPCGADRPPQGSVLGFSAALLAAFLLGALLAAFLLPAIGRSSALLLPIAVLIAVGLVDWRRPLTPQPQR